MALTMLNLLLFTQLNMTYQILTAGAIDTTWNQPSLSSRLHTLQIERKKGEKVED